MWSRRRGRKGQQRNLQESGSESQSSSVPGMRAAHQNRAGTALGSDLKQSEDLLDRWSHNVSMSHQEEVEGDFLNPMTRATSRYHAPQLSQRWCMQE